MKIFILLFTVVTNYSSPATTATEFNSLYACEAAARSHEVRVMKADVRTKVIWTCSSKD